MAKQEKERGTKGAKVGVVDRAQFLTAAQVSALVDATPWPYNVLVNLAAWSGLRAAELGGLQIHDIEVSSNGGMKLRVERTAAAHGLTKTDGTMRVRPVPGPTASLVRDYLTEHPRRQEPGAPLFPGVRLTTPRPTGVRADTPAPGAAITGVEETPHRARLRRTGRAGRLTHWPNSPWRTRRSGWCSTGPSRYATRVSTRPCSGPLRCAPTGRRATWCSRRGCGSTRSAIHTRVCARRSPASRCGRWPSGWGTRTRRRPNSIYTHLYVKADHDDEMAALGALATRKPTYTGNVVPLHG